LDDYSTLLLLNSEKTEIQFTGQKTSTRNLEYCLNLMAANMHRKTKISHDKLLGSIFISLVFVCVQLRPHNLACFIAHSQIKQYTPNTTMLQIIFEWWRWTLYSWSSNAIASTR